MDGLIHVAAIDSPGLTSCVANALRAVELLGESGLTLEEKENWNPESSNLMSFLKTQKLLTGSQMVYTRLQQVTELLQKQFQRNLKN